MANKALALSKICFELAVTFTFAADRERCRPVHCDSSGGGHGRAGLNPLFQISSSDAWAASRLRNMAQGAFNCAAAPDLGGCCAP